MWDALTKGPVALFNFFIRIIILFSLPLILLISPDTPKLFLPLHLIFSLMILFTSLYLLLKGERKYEKQFIAISFVPILYALTILYILPQISFLKSSIALLALIIGLYIPVVNLKLTWWIYTLGGLTRLPSAHTWMQQELNLQNKPGIGLAEMILLSMGGVVTAQIIYASSKESITPALLQSTLPFFIFGSALTAGTAFAKINYLSKLNNTNNSTRDTL